MKFKVLLLFISLLFGVEEIVVVGKRESPEEVYNFLEREGDFIKLSSSGFGQFSSISVRGGKGDYTSLFFEGVPLKEPSSPTFDLSQIPDLFDTLYIFKNPRSVTYESIGGGLSFKLLEPKESKVRFSFLGGSFDTFKLKSEFMGKEGKIFYNIKGVFFKTGGIDASKLGKGERDYFNSSGFSFKVGYKLREGSFKVFGLGFDNKLNFDYCPKPDGNCIQKSNAKLFGINLLINKVNLLASHQEYRRAYEGDAKNYGSFNSSFDYLRLDYNLGPLKRLRAKVGLSLSEEGARTQTLKAKRGERALYLKATYGLKGLIFSGGFRYSEPKAVRGSNLKVVLVLKNLNLFGGYYEGYKRPQLFNLYDKLYGNPNLRPELSYTKELGLNLKGKKFSLKLSYFDTLYSNQIFFSPKDFKPYNLGKGKSFGREIGLKYKGRPFFLKFSYNKIRSFCKEGCVGLKAGEQLYRIPKEFFSLNFGFKFLSLEVFHASRRRDYDYSKSKIVYLKPYTLINLSLSKEFKSYELLLEVKNLTDERYEIAKNYNTLPRSLFLSLIAKF